MRSLSPNDLHCFGHCFGRKTLVMAILGLSTVSLYAAQPTATTLAASSNSVNAGTPVTLTATVTSNGAPVTPGQVVFCNAAAPHCQDRAILGAAQLTSNGTATIRLLLGLGRHDIYAVFKGTTTYAGSSTMPSVVPIEVHGLQHSTANISAQGAGSNWTLSSTVGAFGSIPPEGTVSFLDVTDNHAIATATINSNFLLPSFAPLAVYPTPQLLQGGTSIAAGDLNGDGVPDLVISSETVNSSTPNGLAQVEVLPGNPARPGQFLQPVAYPVGDSGATAVSTVASIAIGDFNSDGWPDLAVLVDESLTNGTQQDGVSILLNDPAHPGQFLPKVKYATGITPTSVATADFNGDGIPDLVVTNLDPQCQNPQCTIMTFGNTVSILLGDPLHPGQFLPQVTYTTASGKEGTGAQAVVTADFNHDGLPDLAVANLQAAGTFGGNSPINTVSILLNDSAHPGQFLPDVEYSTLAPGVSGSYLNSLAVGDFNGDGLPDLVVASQGDKSSAINDISVLLNDPAHPGQFLTAANYPSGTLTDNVANAVAVGDFNGDGLLDIAATNLYDVGTLLGDPANPGQFKGPVTYKALGSWGIVAADFNGDGLSDIAETNFGSSGNYKNASVGILLADITQTVFVTLDPGKTNFVYASYSGDSNTYGYQSCEISLINAPAYPVISGVTVSRITATSATISWTTNVPTYGGVNYGTTANLGSKTPWVNPVSATHSFTITSLTPGITYDYQAWAVSYSSGCNHWTTFSPTATFTTAAK